MTLLLWHTGRKVRYICRKRGLQQSLGSKTISPSNCSYACIRIAMSYAQRTCSASVYKVTIRVSKRANEAAGRQARLLGPAQWIAISIEIQRGLVAQRLPESYLLAWVKSAADLWQVNLTLCPRGFEQASWKGETVQCGQHFCSLHG